MLYSNCKRKDIKMKKHIENLKELKRITCLDCSARKKGWACCISKLDNFKLCQEIISLDYAIEMLQVIQKDIHKKEEK